MQIQLKQNEIVAALKQYVSSQGINLKGKQVDITFTAGRKEAGLSADLVIEDIEIPGGDVEIEAVDPVKPPPALSVVKTTEAAFIPPAGEAKAGTGADEGKADQAEAQSTASASGEAQQAEEEGYSNEPLGTIAGAAPATKTTSLFG